MWTPTTANQRKLYSLRLPWLSTTKPEATLFGHTLQHIEHYLKAPRKFQPAARQSTKGLLRKRNHDSGSQHELCRPIRSKIRQYGYDIQSSSSGTSVTGRCPNTRFRLEKWKLKISSFLTLHMCVSAGCFVFSSIIFPCAYYIICATADPEHSAPDPKWGSLTNSLFRGSF